MKLALCTLVLVASLAAGGASARPVSQGPTVFAAASLSDAFPKIARSAKYSFGGSNALAAQIRLGAPADVFASANMALPRALYKDRLCSKPVVFTRNSLVLIVPRSNPANINSLYDLRKSGVKLVIAAPGVPVGAYTIRVLAKVALNEADAGFVYSTDARTVPRKVSAVKIPARAQPNVQYGICVVAAGSRKPAARAFVKRVLGKAGQRILISYGFLPRVKPRR